MIIETNKYTISVKEAFDKIQAGYTFHHKGLGEVTVTSIDRNRNSISVLAKGQEHTFSLPKLMELGAIEPDSIFRLKAVEVSKPKGDIWFVSDDINDIIPGDSQPEKHIQITYSDIFEGMDTYDKSNEHYSKHFWHFTHSDNLIEILKAGFFRSRQSLERNPSMNIIYDNYKHNEVSRAVMDNNKSKLLKGYVRFYLRPLNATFFKMFLNNSKYDQNKFAVVSIKRSALYESKKPTYLYPRNAHSAPDEFFNRANAINDKKGQSFVLPLFDHFNMSEIYSQYDPTQDSWVKSAQMAEFLVKDCLSVSFIHKIYFRNNSSLYIFMEKLTSAGLYNKFADKCEVNPSVFAGYTK